MRDSIIIKDLEVTTCIGVPEEERATPQKLLVSVDMQTNTQAAGESDDITKSIDYAQVYAGIQKLAVTERKTLEKFAEDIAQYVIEEYNTSPVSVEIKKFILPETDYVAVSITRP